MCLAVSWKMADGDLVRMIPRGHGGGRLTPTQVPLCLTFYLFSFAFMIHPILFSMARLALFANVGFALVSVFNSFNPNLFCAELNLRKKRLGLVNWVFRFNGPAYNLKLD